jgi:hypothetical protein
MSHQPTGSNTEPAKPDVANLPQAGEEVIDRWIGEVQHALDAEARSPRKKADAIAQIKVRYQQQVLGIRPRNKDE